MKKQKKLIALLICLFTIISTMSISAFSATSSTIATNLNSVVPIVTYASPLSGASKVYAYSNSSLSKKQSSYYINSFTEQIVITEISSNGKAVKVVYPNSSGTFRTKWFKADDILGLTSVSITSGSDAKQEYKTYRMKSSASVTSYGSISKNDSFIGLGKHKIGNQTYYPTVYDISKTKINGVSGIKHKLALATSKVKNKSTPTNTTPTTSTPTNTSNENTFFSPVKNGSISQGFGKYCSWRNKSSYGYRPYHLGVDYCAKEGTKVYAITSGTVKFAGWGGSSNAYTVVIQHTISGKTVYSFYAHFNKTGDLKVKSGEKINAGQLIGYIGNSGSSTAPHTHVGVVDTYWNGSYYGYSASFSTGAKKYKCNINGSGNITYYDPEYIVKYGKLP